MLVEYTTGLLGVDARVTVSIHAKGDPIYEMKAATRRFAQQGARQCTLVPRRNGKGWAKKKEGVR